jgi:diguanylate cyclase (GGDEF)-like protein
MLDETISHEAPFGPSSANSAGLSTISQVVAGWGGAAADWVRSGSEAVKWLRRGDDALHEFAERLRLIRDPDEVGVALVQFAHRVTGTSVVELSRREGAGRPPRRIARWPEPGAEGGPVSLRSGRATAGVPLCLPLSLGKETWGTLSIWVAQRRRWSPRCIRRLLTLGLMATAAERALRLSGQAGVSIALDPITGLHSEPMLRALLDFCVAQAHRHREPLALLCVGLDGLAEVRESLGPEFADAVLQQAARALVGSIRASDVTGRLDANRFLAILPTASIDDAPCIAEAVRRAIGEACFASAADPPPTASIGVAIDPGHGRDAATLLAAAREALALAQARGGNRTQLAQRPPSPTLQLASRAG